jgi:hypothetical protein
MSCFLAEKNGMTDADVIIGHRYWRVWGGDPIVNQWWDKWRGTPKHSKPRGWAILMSVPITRSHRGAREMVTVAYQTIGCGDLWLVVMSVIKRGFTLHTPSFLQGVSQHFKGLYPSYPSSIDRSYPQPTHPIMPNGTVIGHATRIWEQNIYWPMYSQCGIWDVKSRGVDVWECIKDREFISHPRF